MLAIDARYTEDLDAYAEELCRYLRGVVEESRVPGAVLEVLANGNRLSLAVGDIIAGAIPMPRVARFDIGRSYRLLEALVILDLVGRGTLAIDAPVAKYLPELNDSAFGQAVVLEHCLTDTCGYRAARGADFRVLEHHTWEALIESLRGARPLFAPGTVPGRILEAPALLAEIVARNTGQSLPLHASRILEQLGIDNAVYAATPTDYAVPHALDGRTGKSRPIALSGIAEFWKSAHPGLRLCPADFMILVDTIMRSREGRDANTAETRRARALQQSRVQMPAVAYATIAEEPPISAGLGCREFRSGWFGSNGATSGHSFHVRYHGTHRFALVLGTNAHAPAVCERVTREIARSLGIEIEVPSSPESGTLPDTRELAGRYAGTSGPDIHVRVEGSELICEFAERAKVSMRIRIEPNGRGFTKIATGLWTLGFFMDARGDPCIVLNDISYRKAGSELPNDSR